MNVMDGWIITDLAATGHVTSRLFEDVSLTITTEETVHLNRDVYWSAPEPFIGNKVLGIIFGCISVLCGLMLRNYCH